MFSNRGWLEIISIILMVFVDEQTFLSLYNVKNRYTRHSYLFDHDNVPEWGGSLNFKQILTFDSREL